MASVKKILTRRGMERLHQYMSNWILVDDM